MGSTQAAVPGRPRWRASGWASAQKAYVDGWNAGLTDRGVELCPVSTEEIRDAWRRGYREGDAAARLW